MPFHLLSALLPFHFLLPRVTHAKLFSINRIHENRIKWNQLAGIFLLAGSSIAVCVSGQVSLAAIFGFILVNLCLGVTLVSRFPATSGWALRLPQLAWVTSAFIALNLLDAWTGAALLPDAMGVELAAAPGLFAVAFWLAAPAVPDHAGKGLWKGLSLFWLIVCETVWLGVGNFQDQILLSYAALLSIVLTLILSKRRFHYRALATQAVNTAIVLLIGLPVADAFVRLLAAPPAPSESIVTAKRPSTLQLGGISVQNARQFYSFSEARGDPAKFSIWWNFFSAGFTRAAQAGLLEPLPGHRPPFRLRPGSRVDFLDCPISINSRGFRGPEIAVPKGAVYRIVCIGESTTFGMTFRKDDTPWPDLLARMINGRLKPSRPVEVVNAGVPALDLSDNLDRLVPEILPLRPDLIISYHGYNGFRMIDSSLPPSNGPPLPPYPRRAFRLAADFEYRLKVRAFLRQFAPTGSRPLPLPPPLETRYAACYRQLIAAAQTNRIGLALADYCMAVDETSDQKLINFYYPFGSGILAARSGVNTIHSEIVRQLAARNPGVIFIDTQPGLRGDPEKFVDIVHFTQEGRQQLAENIFAAIRPRLEHDLAEPNK